MLDYKNHVECLGACLETRHGKEAYDSYFFDKEHFDFGVVDGFIARLGQDTRVIIFRGSDEFQDWLSNFLFAKKRIPYDGVNPKIRVHAGFINAYKEKMRPFIHEKMKGFKKAIVAGQSLGAAIAILCAVDIQYNFEASVYCLPFGSPKVGNKHFVESFNKRVPDTYRYVHGRDFIPFLPPKLFGFRHVSFMRTFGPKRPMIFWPSVKHHMITIDQVNALRDKLTID